MHKFNQIIKTHIKLIFNKKRKYKGRTLKRIIHLFFFGPLFFSIVSFHIWTYNEVNITYYVTLWLNAPQWRNIYIYSKNSKIHDQNLFIKNHNLYDENTFLISLILWSTFIFVLCLILLDHYQIHHVFSHLLFLTLCAYNSHIRFI